MSERPLPPHVLAAIERAKAASDRVLPPTMTAAALELAPRPTHEMAARQPRRGPRIRVAPKKERTAADGTVFASKKELGRYYDLLIYQRTGHALFFLRQVPFHLPGGVKYVADFLVFWRDGRVTVEDTKGFRTEMYRAKKKIVEALYPVKIEEL